MGLPPPHPPPFEQCSKKLHFFERSASLTILMVLRLIMKPYTSRLCNHVPEVPKLIILIHLEGEKYWTTPRAGSFLSRMMGAIPMSEEKHCCWNFWLVFTFACLKAHFGTFPILLVPVSSQRAKRTSHFVDALPLLLLLLYWELGGVL